MKIGVMGNGHVGLVTCLSLAEIGHTVVGTDLDAAKMRTVQAGRVHFYEPDVDEALPRLLATGRVRFTGDPAEALGGAEVVFICVGTPAGPDGEADLAAVDAAASDVAHHAGGRIVLVQKSTVPVGTAERIAAIVSRERHDPSLRVEIVSNPEFLREGHALQDALHPERIVVGSRSRWALERMRRLFIPLIEQGSRFVPTDPNTAELAKLACNGFLATKISFANALARIAERAGADVDVVTSVMGDDPRIGTEFLGAGLGYGGYCLPKDVPALERMADRYGYDFGMLRETMRVNDEALETVIAHVAAAVGPLAGARIGVLGLAFKPGTDDVRSSPALALCARLIDAGAEVVAFDPRVSSRSMRPMQGLTHADDAPSVADDADCIVVATDWPEFAGLDLADLAGRARGSVLVDGRNLLDARAVTDAGFVYVGVGRPSPLARRRSEVA
jgi:UDPglucose 6-dehydrogenase